MHRRPHLKPASPAADRWTATLRSGRAVVIRPIEASDEAAEREFLLRLSPIARHRRFLEQFRIPSAALVQRLTHIDPLRETAFVATADEGRRECIVGACRFAIGTSGDDAECAIAVRDDWQSQGLGELLMRHLIQAARERGLARLWSIDEADNSDMADLAARLGFTRRADPSEPSQVLHELRLAP